LNLRPAISVIAHTQSTVVQQEFLAVTSDVTNRRRGFDVAHVDVGGLSGGDGILGALIYIPLLS
jgi:hypothetical protein